MIKRLRILAGPNGSGKTSVYRELRDKFHWGVFINADEIERSLRLEGELDLREYGVTDVSAESFYQAYICYFSEWKTQMEWSLLDYADGVLRVADEKYVDSYFAAFIVAFIRDYLLEHGISFSIETVMSHPSKVELMRRAREMGYRVYLYFVSTESADINVGRVRSRVAEGGHDVPEDKIRNRYSRSLDQLLDAIRNSDRAYLFDNSAQRFQLLAEYDKDTVDFNVKSSSLWLQSSVLSKMKN